MSIAFLLTSLIVVVSPGTGVLFTVSQGLSHGPRASVVAALGCTLGILPQMAAAITGLAAILHTSAVAFAAVKFVGVAYLLYMAWNTVLESGSLQVGTVKARSAARVVVKAVLINLLNPKLSLFFVAFLPQFVVSGDRHPIVHMLELSGVFMLLTLGVFVGYGVFAARMRRYVLSDPRILSWMRRGFAAAFVALGAKLALAER